MSHLTYAEAIITGIVQGVSELFPVSSLGHNVLIPALLGGQWAKDLNVTAEGSPYLAFVVALHVATALAMIVYFWRDWVRIIRGLVTSVRDRQVVTSDQRLAWMIILGTIPVGLAGVLLQKLVTGIFARPTLTALFLAVNGGILLYSERQRQLRAAPRRQLRGAGPDSDWDFEGDPWEADGGWEDGRQPSRGRGRGDPRMDRDPRLGGGPRAGYPDPAGEERTQVWNSQPGQQQWQGPDPRYDDPRYDDPRYGQDRRRPRDPRYAQDPRRGPGPRDPQYSPEPPAPAQGPSFTPSFTPSAPAPQAPQFDPRGAQDPRYAQDQEYGRDQQYAGDPGYGRDPRYAAGAPQAPTFTPAGQQGPGGGAGEAPRSVPDERGPGGGARPPWEDGRQAAADPWDPYSGQDSRDFGPQDPRDFERQDPRRRRPAPDHGYDDRLERADADEHVAADRRLATMSFKQAVLVGAWQIAALLPGISRDGIVTVGGMRRGLRREDAVRFSFLLSAPIILAAGVLKMPDLMGPAGKGITGQVVLGSLLSFVGAYFSVRFLTRYFSESKSLKPFGIYCLAFGVLAFAILLVR